MMGSCSVDYVCLNHFPSFFSRRERRVFHAENAKIFLCEFCVESFIFFHAENAKFFLCELCEVLSFFLAENAKFFLCELCVVSL